MSRTIAVDFGASNSAMAILEDNKLLVIPNSEGELTTPSLVSFTKDGKSLVGKAAQRQAVSNPERTISSAKRKIGTNHIYSVGKKKYTPTDIVAMLLKKLKEDAEQFLKDYVSQAIITVPSYFNNSQRQALYKAGEIIGLEVLRLINTPSAVGLDYALRDKSQSGKDKGILVFDFGAGTLSISKMIIGSDVVEVRATAGSTLLGGLDYDMRIYHYIADKIIKESGFDIRTDYMASQRLLEAAEKAKIELLAVNTTEINIPYFYKINGEMKSLEALLERTTFDETTKDLTDKAIALAHQVLNDYYESDYYRVCGDDIDLFLLAGGSSRLPSVRTAINDAFGGKAQIKITSGEAILNGAAYMAALLSGGRHEKLLLEVYPFSVGIETKEGSFTKIIHRNTTIPTSNNLIFTTAVDNQMSIELHVLQGEYPNSKNNKSLGRYIFEGIPPAPRGLPQIEVCVDIDNSSLINLRVKDLATEKEQIYRIASACDAD